MDIKAKAEEIISKVKNDKDFSAKFKENPIKAIEEVTGAGLPEEQINSILNTVKTKAAEGVSKVRSDPDFVQKLKENPVKAVEDVTGIDLPDEQIHAAVKGIRDKLTGNKN